MLMNVFNNDDKLWHCCINRIWVNINEMSLPKGMFWERLRIFVFSCVRH